MHTRALCQQATSIACALIIRVDKRREQHSGKCYEDTASSASHTPQVVLVGEQSEGGGQRTQVQASGWKA